MAIKNLFVRAKSFILECVRVWKVTRKPSKDEFMTIVKVTGMGMLIIGFIGFVINMLWRLARIT